MPDIDLKINVLTEEGIAALQILNEEFNNTQTAVDTTNEKLESIKNISLGTFLLQTSQAVRETTSSIVDLVSSYGNLIKSQADELKQLALLSNAIGKEIDYLDALDKVASSSGQSIGDLSGQMLRLSSRIVDSSGNLSEVGEAIVSLGIAVKTSSGEMRDRASIYEDVSNALAKMEDKTKAVSIAFKLGRQPYAQFIQSLQARGMDMTGAIENMSKYSYATDLQSKNLVDYSKKLKSFGFIWSEIGEAATGELAGRINPLLDSFEAKLQDIAKNAPDLASLLYFGGTTIQKLPQLIQLVANLTVALYGLKSLKMKELFSSVLPDLSKTKILPDIKDKVISILPEIKSIKGKGKGRIDEVVNKIQYLFPEIRDIKGTEKIDLLRNKILTSIPDLSKTKIPDLSKTKVLPEIKDKIISILPEIKEIKGRGKIDDAVKKIQYLFPEIRDIKGTEKIDSLRNKILTAIPDLSKTKKINVESNVDAAVRSIARITKDDTKKIKIIEQIIPGKTNVLSNEIRKLNVKEFISTTSSSILNSIKAPFNSFQNELRSLNLSRKIERLLGGIDPNRLSVTQFNRLTSALNLARESAAGTSVRLANFAYSLDILKSLNLEEAARGITLGKQSFSRALLEATKNLFVVPSNIIRAARSTISVPITNTIGTTRNIINQRNLERTIAPVLPTLGTEAFAGVINSFAGISRTAHGSTERINGLKNIIAELGDKIQPRTIDTRIGRIKQAFQNSFNLIGDILAAGSIALAGKFRKPTELAGGLVAGEVGGEVVGSLFSTGILNRKLKNTLEEEFGDVLETSKERRERFKEKKFVSDLYHDAPLPGGAPDTVRYRNLRRDIYRRYDDDSIKKIRASLKADTNKIAELMTLMDDLGNIFQNLDAPNINDAKIKELKEQRVRKNEQIEKLLKISPLTFRTPTEKVVTEQVTEQVTKKQAAKQAAKRFFSEQNYPVFTPIFQSFKSLISVIAKFIGIAGVAVGAIYAINKAIEIVFGESLFKRFNEWKKAARESEALFRTPIQKRIEETGSAKIRVDNKTIEIKSEEELDKIIKEESNKIKKSFDLWNKVKNTFTRDSLDKAKQNIVLEAPVWTAETSEKYKAMSKEAATVVSRASLNTKEIETQIKYIQDELNNKIPNEKKIDISLGKSKEELNKYTSSMNQTIKIEQEKLKVLEENRKEQLETENKLKADPNIKRQQDLVKQLSQRKTELESKRGNKDQLEAVNKQLEIEQGKLNSLLSTYKARYNVTEDEINAQKQLIMSLEEQKRQQRDIIKEQERLVELKKAERKLTISQSYVNLANTIEENEVSLQGVEKINVEFVPDDSDLEKKVEAYKRSEEEIKLKLELDTKDLESKKNILSSEQFEIEEEKIKQKYDEAMQRLNTAFMSSNNLTKYQRNKLIIEQQYDVDVKSGMSPEAAANKRSQALFELRIKTVKDSIEKQRKSFEEQLKSVDTHLRLAETIGDSELKKQLEQRKEILNDSLISQQAIISQLGNPEDLLKLDSMRAEEKLRRVEVALKNISERYDKIAATSRIIQTGMSSWASALEASMERKRFESKSPNDMTGMKRLFDVNEKARKEALNTARIERDKEIDLINKRYALARQERKLRPTAQISEFEQELLDAKNKYQAAVNEYNASFDRQLVSFNTQIRAAKLEVKRFEGELIGFTIQLNQLNSDAAKANSDFAASRDNVSLAVQELRKFDEIVRKSFEDRKKQIEVEREASKLTTNKNDEIAGEQRYSIELKRIENDRLAHTRDIQRRYNELVLKGISDRTEYEKEILNRMEIRDDPLEERRKQVEKIVKLLRDEATQLEFQGRLTEALRKRNEALNLEKEKGKTKLSLGQEILLAGDGRASIESFLKSKFNVAKVYEGSFNINKEQLGRDLAQSTIDTLKNILDTSKMSSLSSGNIDKLRTALIDTVVDVMNKVLGK